MHHCIIKVEALISLEMLSIAETKVFTLAETVQKQCYSDKMLNNIEVL